MKQKPPEIVTAYRKAKQMARPRCCHTCEHFSTTGMCRVYNMEPPQEFTEALNQCDEWKDEIPF